MTTEARATTYLAEDGEQPRLLAIEIGDWPGLGHNVRLTLGGERTVLVGKNGAGKSLLLQGIYRGARAPIYFSGRGPIPPRSFRCEVERPGAAPIGYEYKFHLDEAEDDVELTPSDPPRLRVRSWDERCWQLDSRTDIWRISNGTLTFGGGSDAVPFSPGASLLSVRDEYPTISAEATQLRRLLSSVAMIPAGVPRNENAFRREIIVRSGPGPRRWRPTGPWRADGLAYTLALLFERRPEVYEEFVRIVRSLGLVNDVVVKIYEDPQASVGSEERRDFASVLFDGLNIGLLSDGTLRISEIVVDLLRQPGSILLIEEPETAVHPGLLSRLLALAESYSADRQVIMSTHSPIVVNWCEPKQLRLVERVDRSTVVRTLDTEEVKRIDAYLRDDGTFADYIYSRSSS